MKINSLILDNTVKQYSDVRFSHLTHKETLFENLSFNNCKFSHCNFSSSQFIRCKFADCDFEHCNLSTITINDSAFSQVHFTDTKMIGINWTAARWPQIKLTSPIGFLQCDLSQSNFFGLSLIEIEMDTCKIHHTDFRECDLSNAYLANSDFYNSLFAQTKLNYANFSNAINYTINIHLNTLKKATFTFPEVVALLNHLDIEIEGLP